MNDFHCYGVLCGCKFKCIGYFILVARVFWGLLGCHEWFLSVALSLSGWLLVTRGFLGF